MKTFQVFLTETLQRDFEIEAESEEDALKKLESLYENGKVYLDYSDLKDVEFSNCPYSKAEIELMNTRNVEDKLC